MRSSAEHPHHGALRRTHNQAYGGLAEKALPQSVREKTPDEPQTRDILGGLFNRTEVTEELSQTGGLQGQENKCDLGLRVGLWEGEGRPVGRWSQLPAVSGTSSTGSGPQGGWAKDTQEHSIFFLHVCNSAINVKIRCFLKERKG